LRTSLLRRLDWPGQPRRALDLVKELDDTGWPLPDGFTLRPDAKRAQSGALEEQFENFKAMCALYVDGDQQYVPSRVQSGNAHPSYIGAMAYIVPETGELSATAVTDSYVYLVDIARCVILAGHAFAPADSYLPGRRGRPSRDGTGHRVRLVAAPLEDLAYEAVRRSAALFLVTSSSDPGTPRSEPDDYRRKRGVPLARS
jgi:hypothetical protein